MIRDWPMLAIVLAFRPSVRAELRIENVQPCYSAFSPARPNEVHYWRTEPFTYRWDVAGIQQTDAGWRLDVSMELRSSNGQTIVAQTQAYDGRLPLGGDRWRLAAFLRPKDPIPLGDYTLVLNVKDKNSKQVARHERKVQVRPPQLAVSFIKLGLEPNCMTEVSSTNPVGTALFAILQLSGVQNDHGLCDVEVLWEVLDARTGACLLSERPIIVRTPLSPFQPGQTAREEPFTMVESIGELNRPGEFILRWHVTDRVAHKTIAWDVPLHVLPF